MAVALVLNGCASGNGSGKKSPDEFAIVTKAPLTLPPDFSLRPPRPGETRPEEKSPSERAQQLLLGDESTAPPTKGELALIQSAGVLTADPNIRSILGAEGGGWAEKDASLANRILFWRVNGNQVDDSAAPLKVEDPEAWLAGRMKSIEAVTGGGEIQINKKSKILNLPGVR